VELKIQTGVIPSPMKGQAARPPTPSAPSTSSTSEPATKTEPPKKKKPPGPGGAKKKPPPAATGEERIFVRVVKLIRFLDQLIVPSLAQGPVASDLHRVLTRFQEPIISDPKVVPHQGGLFEYCLKLGNCWLISLLQMLASLLQQMPRYSIATKLLRTRSGMPVQ